MILLFHIFILFISCYNLINIYCSGHMKRKAEEEKAAVDTKEKMSVLLNIVKRFLCILVFLDRSCAIVPLSFCLWCHFYQCAFKLHLGNIDLLFFHAIFLYFVFLHHLFVFIFFVLYYNLITLCLNSGTKRHSKADQGKEPIETSEKLWVLSNSFFLFWAYLFFFVITDSSSNCSFLIFFFFNAFNILAFLF